MGDKYEGVSCANCGWGTTREQTVGGKIALVVDCHHADCINQDDPTHLGSWWCSNFEPCELVRKRLANLMQQAAWSVRDRPQSEEG